MATPVYSAVFVRWLAVRTMDPGATHQEEQANGPDEEANPGYKA